MCTVCKKSKVSGMAKKTLGGFKLERLAAVGGGAIASKAIANPIVKALKKQFNWTDDSKIATYAPVAIKLAGGYFAMQQKNQMVKDAGLGAIAAGLLELAEITMPDVMAPKFAGNTLLPIKMTVNGIGAPVQYLNLQTENQRVAGFEEDMRIAGNTGLGGRM